MKNKSQLLQDIEEIKENREDELQEQKEAYKEIRRKLKKLKKHNREKQKEIESEKKEQMQERLKKEFRQERSLINRVEEKHSEAKKVAEELNAHIVHNAVTTAMDVQHSNITYNETISIRSTGVHKHNKRKNSKISQQQLIEEDTSHWSSNYHQNLIDCLLKHLTDDEVEIIKELMEISKEAEKIPKRFRYKDGEDYRDRKEQHEEYNEVRVRFSTDSTVINFNNGYRTKDRVNFFSPKTDKIKKTLELRDEAMDYIEDVEEVITQKHQHNQELKQKAEAKKQKLERLQ